MSPAPSTRAVAPDAYAERRAIALANVRLFRALARQALRDGLPRGASRAANARRAAWIVLRSAQREARLHRPARQVLALDALAT